MVGRRAARRGLRDRRRWQAARPAPRAEPEVRECARWYQALDAEIDRGCTRRSGSARRGLSVPAGRPHAVWPGRPGCKGSTLRVMPSSSSSSISKRVCMRSRICRPCQASGARAIAASRADCAILRQADWRAPPGVPRCLQRPRCPMQGRERRAPPKRPGTRRTQGCSRAEPRSVGASRARCATGRAAAAAYPVVGGLLGRATFDPSAPGASARESAGSPSLRAYDRDRDPRRLRPLRLAALAPRGPRPQFEAASRRCTWQVAYTPDNGRAPSAPNWVTFWFP